MFRVLEADGNSVVQTTKAMLPVPKNKKKCSYWDQHLEVTGERWALAVPGWAWHPCKKQIWSQVIGSKLFLAEAQNQPCPFQSFQWDWWRPKTCQVEHGKSQHSHCHNPTPSGDSCASLDHGKNVLGASPSFWLLLPCLLQGGNWPFRAQTQEPSSKLCLTQKMGLSPPELATLSEFGGWHRRGDGCIW